MRAWAQTGKRPNPTAVEVWQNCIIGMTYDDQNESGGGPRPAAMSKLMYSFSIMNIMRDFTHVTIIAMEDHSIKIINGYDFTNVALTLWSYAWSGMCPCADLLQVLGPTPVVHVQSVRPQKTSVYVCFQAPAQSVARPLCFESIKSVAIFLF